MKICSKAIGSTLILVGTTVGAGVLALPIVSAAMGFPIETFELMAVGVMMLFTALLTLEVNLAFPAYRNHFSTMAAATLGRFGQGVVWIACLLLLNALIAAYIEGNSSLLVTSILKLSDRHMSGWISPILITVVFGGIVCCGTRLVDWCERGLFSFKGVLLCATLILLMPHIHVAYLIGHPGAGKYILIAIPIFIISFGFHPAIPSITNYIGTKPKTLKWVIVCAALIPLIVYLLWITAVLGVIPLLGRHGFIHFAHKKNAVVNMLNAIHLLVQNRWLTVAINAFSDITMTTAFLGVGLGLFDFLADACKRKNTAFGRLQTGLLTFIPPLGFVLFYPKGFVYVLSYAAFFAIIIIVIMPALMAYRLRRSKTLHSPFRVIGGTPLLVTVVLFGIFAMIIEILFVLHLLPTLP